MSTLGGEPGLIKENTSTLIIDNKEVQEHQIFVFFKEFCIFTIYLQYSQEFPRHCLSICYLIWMINIIPKSHNTKYDGLEKYV